VKKPTARLDTWAEAQKRFHLSDLHIQMARELGLNPKKFGGLANHRQEPWKLPLPEFIAECYIKRFHRVAYPALADIVSGPLPSRLREVNQTVIITRNRFSRPRPCPLACICAH
jgi:hypothetical protein